MTRVSKISRLPIRVRDELIQRLADGEEGTPLLKWLNNEPRVKEIMKRQFNGRRVTKQNLSVWRTTGFADWQRDQLRIASFQRVVEHAGNLAETADENEVSDHFTTILSAELADLAAPLLEQQSDPVKRLELMERVASLAIRLRRSDQRSARLRLDQDRAESMNLEREKRQHEENLAKLREKACAPLWAAMKLNTLAACFGGGESGRRAAALILETQHGLEPGSLFNRFTEPSVQPSPSESRQN